MEKAKRMIIAVIAACLLLSGCGNKYKDAYERGLKFLTDGDYEQAITAFTEAIEIDPKQYKVYSARAQAYSETGRKNEAISDLLDALDCGMKAQEIKDDIVNDVFDIVVVLNKDDKEELIKYLNTTGFLDGDVIESISDDLYDILSGLITEYMQEGKSIEDLIKFLKNIGLIEGKETAGKIKDLSVETIIQEIIDYKDEGKSIGELNDDYGKSFRIIDIREVIKKIPNFEQEAQDWSVNGSDVVWDSWYTWDGDVYINVRRVTNGNEYVVSLRYKDVQVFINENYDISYTYFGLHYLSGEGSYFELRIDLWNNESYLIKYNLSPDIKWAEIGSWFTNEYENAVNEWNRVLSKYGLTVTGIYEHDKVLKFLKEYDGR